LGLNYQRGEDYILMVLDDLSAEYYLK
jgi:hypothetical protein